MASHARSFANANEVKPFARERKRESERAKKEKKREHMPLYADAIKIEGTRERSNAFPRRGWEKTRVCVWIYIC